MNEQQKDHAARLITFVVGGALAFIVIAILTFLVVFAGTGLIELFRTVFDFTRSLAVITTLAIGGLCFGVAGYAAVMIKGNEP